MSEAVKAPIRRRASKETRQRQLIEATIKSIAKRGLGATTLSHVSKIAGLSQGIVNLHFKSKEILLTETLKYLRDEYELTWKLALSEADQNPAIKLATLLRVDYSSSITDQKKLAVWLAFWGEVKSRPTYQKICQDRVNAYVNVLEEILQQIVKDGNYQDIDTSVVAEGIMAMADGLWVNMLVSTRGLNHQFAEKIMMHYLAQLFPKHKDAFLQKLS